MIGVAVLSLAAAGVLCLPAGTSMATTPSHTRVVADCQHARYEPSRYLVLFCGDGTQELSHLHWSTWTTTHATGHARLDYDDCDPDCADGHEHHVNVHVELQRVRERNGLGRVFTRVITTHDGKRQRYFV